MHYYRIKLSKRIKNTLFTLFFLKYLIQVSSLSTNEHIKKKFAHAFINNTYIFQSMSFQTYAFSCKNWYFGEVFM